MIVFFVISRTSQHHTQDYLGLLLLSGMHHLHNYGGSTIQPLNLSTIIIGKDLVLQRRSGFRENLLQFSQEIYISPKKIFSRMTWSQKNIILYWNFLIVCNTFRYLFASSSPAAIAVAKAI